VLVDPTIQQANYQKQISPPNGGLICFGAISCNASWRNAISFSLSAASMQPLSLLHLLNHAHATCCDLTGAPISVAPSSFIFLKPPFTLRWRHYSIRAKGLIVLSAPLGATILSTVLFFVAKAKNDEAKDWVWHTFEVKALAQNVLTHAIDSESGIRGYLLTKDAGLLETHERAVAALPQAISRVQDLTVDNPRQQFRIANSIGPLMKQRLALEKDLLVKFSAHGYDASLAETLTQGHHKMLELRRAINDFIAEEDSLLGLRQRRAAELDEQTSFAIMETAAFGLCVGLISVLLFARGISKRLDRMVKEAEMLQREEPLSDPPTENDEIGRLGRACHHASRLLAERRAELLRAKAAAEASNSAKTEFLANVSHEVRTPLNGIIGLTELALETELTSTQRDHLDMVKHSADSLLALINDLLDFAKIEAGKLALEECPFELHELIEKTIRPLCMRAESKGLLLRANLDPDVTRFITGDALRLRQVLINLIDNAIKFTHEGSVTLDVKSATSSAGVPGLHFAITDTGVGIPEEKQQMIFDAFSQADSSTTRQYGGTGLGLAICSDLVRLMGGRITVESRQGHGSAFRFTINATPAEMPSTFSHRTEEREQAAPVLSMRLLVVEDNPVNQSVACGILGKMGHRATTANNGREAVRLVQTQRFDAILMDVQMPEMDGLTATARIREWESEHGLRTPIVAMTAHAGEDNRNRCLNAGMDDYVAKPISRSNLADALTRALKGDAPSPAASSASVPSQDFTSEELFNKLDRDEELFAQVAELFLATMPPLLSQLRDEFQRKNFDTATRTAHSLRGSLANIGAAKSAALAAELEELAQKRLSDDAEELLHELKHRVDRIFTELGRHTTHVAAC